MDPLSDVLSLLKLDSYGSGGLDAAGDWAIAYEPSAGINFFAAVSGSCWLAMDGLDARRVESGDCYLLPRGRAFRIASDLSVEPVDCMTVFPATHPGGIASFNGGGDVFGIGGYFDLRSDDASLLLDMLPPIVRIGSEADKALLRWCIERMRQELREPQPGGFVVAQHLATTMLVAALRVHLANVEHHGTGWLYALADPAMAAAIGAMHEHPESRWTVQSLAQRAGMSRTSFTQRFKETVGATPMEYLTRWRMMLAGDRLAESRDSIAEVAVALGYESESAFSTAFKRLKGTSPRQYSRDRAS